MRFRLTHAHWRLDGEKKKKYEKLDFTYKFNNENNWNSLDP
jgi:hypothetical protein